MTEADDGVVQAELRKAEQALLEAEALSHASLYNGAASRAYYVAYHAASALLNRAGVQWKSSKGWLCCAFIVAVSILSGCAATNIGPDARLEVRHAEAALPPPRSSGAP